MSHFEEYWGTEFPEEKPNATVNCTKRPPPTNQPTLIKHPPCDTPDNQIRWKRHKVVVVNHGNQVKTIDNIEPSRTDTTPSRLYHITADNLVHCPVVHIPRNKKTNVPKSGMCNPQAHDSMQVADETEPSAGHKNGQTDYMNRPRQAKSRVQGADGMKLPVGCKYPRRGAISFVHDESEEITEHKNQHAVAMCECHPLHEKTVVHCGVLAKPPATRTMRGIPSLTSCNDDNSNSNREVNDFLSTLDWDNQ